ncbi:toll/interleukin-1 receptor domain-containing protein, partial [Vibrio splendidus]
LLFYEDKSGLPRKAAMNLILGEEVRLDIKPSELKVSDVVPTAALFFGGSSLINLAIAEQLVERQISTIPVLDDLTSVRDEIPECLSHINCLSFNDEGSSRAVTALLESVGLLAKSRKIFLSYKRDEARDSALQLYEALSARGFSVFLDTHGIAVGENFQENLWQELCKSDVLLMLDTHSYFTSRWTKAEFASAMAKGISVLRVAWPDVNESKMTAIAEQFKLEVNDFEHSYFKSECVKQICDATEAVRSKSFAVRRLQLLDKIRSGISGAFGEVLNVGQNASAHVRLLSDKELIVFPTVGIPDAQMLHDIENKAKAVRKGIHPVVMYDSVGLNKYTKEHFEWLDKNINTCSLLQAYEAQFKFSNWDE